MKKVFIAFMSLALITTISSCKKDNNNSNNNNSGQSWTEMKNPVHNDNTGTFTNDLLLDGNTIYCATDAPTSGRLFSSTNNGQSWATVASLSVGTTLTLTKSGSNLICGVESDLSGTTTVWTSSNGGSTWTSNSIDGSNDLISIGNSIVLAGGGDGVYKSTDNGITWNLFTTGLPTNPNSGLTIVEKFAVSGQNVFAAMYGGGVAISSDNGSTWTTINNGLPSAMLNTVIPQITANGNSVFVLQNHIVYQTTNNGSSWTQANFSFQNGSISDLVSDGTNLYAVTIDDGKSYVYKSSNNGSSWTKIGQGTGVASESDFSVPAPNKLRISGGKLFAFGEGAMAFTNL